MIFCAQNPADATISEWDVCSTLILGDQTEDYVREVVVLGLKLKVFSKLLSYVLIV